MERSDEEKIADEALLERLFTGFLTSDKKGRQVTSYLTSGSPEEKRARAVLAQQLRDGTLSFLTKELVAVALDPETPSQYVVPTRRIEFKPLKRGPYPEWARNQSIVHYINMQLANRESNRKPTAGEKRLGQLLKRQDELAKLDGPEAEAEYQVVVRRIALESEKIAAKNKNPPKLDHAIKAAEKKFGLSRSQLMDIWAKRSNRFF